MTKQTYIGNGRNKNFYFTFPFFSPDEVLVKINDIVAVEYGLFCNQGVSNSDFPFTGGHVKFTKPPKPTDIVTIERNLQYNRIIDYQETAKINPTTLNQDMNYFFESLKDIKSILNEFNEKYAEFTDTESANDLKERITAVTEQIDNLGDISTINTNISELGTSITNLTNSLNGLAATVGTHTTDIGALQSSVSDIVQNPKHTFPNYSTGISVSATQGGTYTVPSDGFLMVRLDYNGSTVVKIQENNINGQELLYMWQQNNNATTAYLPLLKDMVIYFRELTSSTALVFYPVKND